MRHESFRDWKSNAFLALVVILITLFFAIAGRAALAEAVPWEDYSPVVDFVCLDRSDVLGDLEKIGAPDWALKSISIIQSGNIGKGPIDIIRVSENETAIGWCHATLERDPFRQNIQTPSEGLLALLYSDHAPELLFRAWRRSVGPSVRLARNYDGCDECCVVLTACIANSSPRLSERIFEACSGDEACMAKRYLRGGRAGSDHRTNRIEAWREECG